MKLEFKNLTFCINFVGITMLRFLLGGESVILTL